MIEIDPATINDDPKSIIKLIYKTDPFIYPAMCSNDYAYFERVMSDYIKQDSIFSYKNITLAKEDENIVGLLLAFTKEQKLPVISNAIENRVCLQKTINDYFKILLDKLEPDTLYINNLCVDENCRNKGVGRLLLLNFIEKAKNAKIVLDCLGDNIPAIALYQKCGFKITKRFDGFSGDDRKKVGCVELRLGNKQSS